MRGVRSLLKMGLFETLSRLDLFGWQVSLLHKGEEKKADLLGILGSIAILSIFLGVFNNKIGNFFSLSELSYSTSYNYNSNFQLSLNASNSLFAVGLTNHQLAGSPLFSLAVLPSSRFSNGSKVVYPPLRMAPCDREKWARLGHEQYFDHNQLASFLCPSDDFAFKLLGEYGSPEFAFLKIAVGICQSNCSPSLTNDIQDFVKASGGYAQVTVVYQNTKIRYNNTYRPFEAFFDKSFYRFVPFYQQLSVDQYLQRVSSFTDLSTHPFPDLAVSSNFTFTSEKQYTYLPAGPTQTEFFRSFFRVHNSELIIERQVQTLEDFLSFLGGFFSILQIIGSFIFTPFCRFRYMLQIFNSLYENTAQGEEQIEASLLEFIGTRLVIKPLRNRFNLKRLIMLEQAQEIAERQADLLQLFKRVSMAMRGRDESVFQRSKISLGQTETSNDGALNSTIFPSNQTKKEQQGVSMEESNSQVLRQTS